MKERFKVLDIFRGIFASLVFLYHLYPFAATPVINNNFVANSDLFVDFFFILSGFVIAYSYQLMATGNELTNFYRKRFFRLYPLHFILLIIFIVIEAIKGFAAHYVHLNKPSITSNNVYTVITNLFLVNSVKFPHINDVSWNDPSWSISAEVIAYLVFGLTIVAINHNKLNRIKIIIYALIIFVAAYVLHECTGGLTLVYTYNYGFLRGIIGFFTGVLCYNAYNAFKNNSSRLSNYLFHVAEPVFIVGIVIMIWMGRELRNYGFVYETAFFATIFIFAFERGWISDLFKKSKFLHQTGKYSYSIYMTHGLLLSLFNILFIRVLKFPPSAYSYLVVLNYLLIYMVSAWTFKNIEMRFNQASRQDGKKVWWLW